jgi:hypothetical protein
LVAHDRDCDEALTGGQETVILFGMTRRMQLVCVTVTAVSLAAASIAAQATKDGPEPVMLALVKAIYANDAAAYNAVTVPDPRRARLTSGGRVNEAKLRALTEDPGSLQMRKNRPFLYQGKEAAIDTNGRYPVGTTAFYTLAHGGSPMVARLVRQADGWKVDLRWWLAMIDLQSTPPKPGTPEYAARALNAALIAMDRKTAAKYATTGENLDLLFLGAQREPSGVLDALAMEMPIVELGPGEFFPMRDRIVEGSTAPEVKLLLGLFGVVEIPYVVRKVGGEWRVEPQPYFAYFNR